jgi:hypothetical protein
MKNEYLTIKNSFSLSNLTDIISCGIHDIEFIFLRLNIWYLIRLQDKKRIRKNSRDNLVTVSHYIGKIKIEFNRVYFRRIQIYYHTK